MAIKKLNLAVFASGNGSNFEAIAQAIKAKKINCHLALLICDNPKAYVLERAKKFKVKASLVKREDFNNKTEFEEKIILELKANKIDFIVMAGFMRMVSTKLINEFKNKILNVHPSLLPAFKGASAIEDAFNYGAKVTGVTVHFVDEEMDHGPIILQEEIKIKDSDSLETLEAKIHRIEHKIYPQAIRLFAERKLEISGRRVMVRGQ